jgi:YVTN family beta-propeller protein
MSLYVVSCLVLIFGVLAAWTIRVRSRRPLLAPLAEGMIAESVAADPAFLRRLWKRLLQASLIAIGAVAIGGVTAHAQSYTYVTNTDDDTLSLIYTATHEIKNPPVRAIIPLRPEGVTTPLNPVATAVTPYSVAGNANGQFVYTVNKNANTVSVVDTAKAKLIATIPLGPGAAPSNIAISGVRLDPVGGQCAPGHPLWRTYGYVTESGTGKLAIIDTSPDDWNGVAWVANPTFNQVIKTLTVGNGPSAVAVSKPTLEQADDGMFFSAGFYVYVTNATDGTVSVIDADYRSNTPSSGFPLGCAPGAPDDGAFHTVIGSPLTVGTNPTAISFDRYGRWAYVANTGSDTVTAIDACGGSPGTSVSAGTCDLVFLPNFVVANTIELGTSGDPLFTPVHLGGAHPSGIAITIDFTGTHKHQQFRAYVPNPGNDSYSVLDVEAVSPNFQKSIFVCAHTDPNCPQLGDKPTGVSVMYPDEDFVYFTNYGTNSVLVVDSDPDSLGGPGGVLQYNHVVGRIKRGIGSPYPGVSSGANCQPALDPPPPPASEPSRWCGRPLGIANTPRVPYAYVMNSGTNTISVVGASPQIGDPHPILATIPLSFSPTWVTLNRNQDFIFVADNAGGKVHIINTMGQTEVGATNEPMGHPLRLSTPPDGWSAYVSSDDGYIYTVDTVDRSGPGGPGDPFTAGGDKDVTFPIPGTTGFTPMVVHLRQCPREDPVLCDAIVDPSLAVRSSRVQCMQAFCGGSSDAPVALGTILGSIDVHPDNFLGLVAIKDSNKVGIIDTHYDSPTWNQIVGYVTGLPGGSNPTAVAFTHIGNRALVMNSNGTVSLVDTSGDPDSCRQGTCSWSVLQTITVGNGPMAVAFNEHDEDAYVTNSGDGTVSVIQMSDFTVLPPPPHVDGLPDPPAVPAGCHCTLLVGSNPQDVFINLGERVAAYVTNKGSGTVSIIDDQPYNPTFNRVLDTVALPWVGPNAPMPIGIILTEP